jgi:hypothetical protein
MRVYSGIMKMLGVARSAIQQQRGRWLWQTGKGDAVANEANKQGSIGTQMFRETALRKMSSADDLDHYLKVTNPSAWILIGAVAVLIVAGFIWGLTASLPVSTTTTGVIKNGQIACFLPLDDNATVTTDSKVTAAGRETRIDSVDEDPYSKREVSEAIGSDYTTESLDLSQWSYKVVVELPNDMSSWEEGDDVPVVITMKEVAPLVFLFGGA